MWNTELLVHSSLTTLVQWTGRTKHSTWAELSPGAGRPARLYGSLHCSADGRADSYADALDAALRLIEGFPMERNCVVEIILWVDANVSLSAGFNPFGGDRVEPYGRVPDERHADCLGFLDRLDLVPRNIFASAPTLANAPPEAAVAHWTPRCKATKRNYSK